MSGDKDHNPDFDWIAELDEPPVQKCMQFQHEDGPQLKLAEKGFETWTVCKHCGQALRKVIY